MGGADFLYIDGDTYIASKMTGELLCILEDVIY